YLVHLTHNLQWLLSDSITSLLIVNSPSSLAFQLLSFVSQAGCHCYLTLPYDQDLQPKLARNAMERAIAPLRSSNLISEQRF
ncbi:MAG: hypothetical protein KME13_24805, partial [Myxacorys californica WJT36-NPBG1]|nr:hypothetical protein [Myxacorys californica WJT36-NPBG1]